jgi:hypothetical protein
MAVSPAAESSVIGRVGVAPVQAGKTVQSKTMPTIAGSGEKRFIGLGAKKALVKVAVT